MGTLVLFSDNGEIVQAHVHTNCTVY